MFAHGSDSVTIIGWILNLCDMSKLAILDPSGVQIIILEVSEEQEEKLFNVYDENTEVWLSEEGIDEKLGFNISCINYMWFEDEETTIRHEKV